MHALRSGTTLAVRLFFALALATLLARGALAHGWEELDTRHVLERADAIVAVAELAQDAWTVDPAAAPAPVGAPLELRWWTWVTSRVVDGGDADVVAAIEQVAPQWLRDQEPEDVVLDWTDALGELVAHAAARDVQPDEREAAAEALSRPDLDPAEAQAASWLVLLPTLSDAERRDLAPVFARLDALIDAVAR